jgi:hypothetical protein
MATTTINTTEKWVIGADKKPQFKLEDKSTGDDILLSSLSGYGIILWDPNDLEVGRYGVNITGFTSTEVSTVDTYTFEVALDKALNHVEGVYKYRVCAIWVDADFVDATFDAYNDNRETLYNSVAL